MVAWQAPQFISTLVSFTFSMPFNFNSYARKVAEMENWELPIEKQKYTRSASGSAVGGVSSLLLGPFAPIGLIISASTASNAAIKLAIINDEMRSRDEYSSTRLRDVFGGGAISAMTLGIGHGITHVANNLITHATHHAVTQGQHALTHRLGHSVEKYAECAVDEALEEHATSKALLPAFVINRRCDMCFMVG